MADRPRASEARGGNRHLERAAGVRGGDEVRLRGVDEAGLAVAELPGRIGLDEIEDAGAAAADVLLGEWQQLDAGDRSQEIPRLLPDALGVRQMAGVVIRHAQGERMPRSSRLAELRHDLGDVANA